jgi:xanthine dehydrogenase YagR molybdenum-binding subunit
LNGSARRRRTGAPAPGVASALTEGNAVDLRYGSLINQDLGSYLAPVQADIGELDAIMLDEVDDKANPMGIKGVGELGISGAGSAVANAIYNACGVRVRDYPITPDKVLAALGAG